jgi:hypothetical protein
VFNEYDPLLFIFVIFVFAGTEESFTERVPLVVVPSDATPDIVEPDEPDTIPPEPPEPQPLRARPRVTAHNKRIVEMFFLMIRSPSDRVVACVFGHKYRC